MLKIAVCDDDFETFQHMESLLIDFEINHVMDQEISFGNEDYYPNGDAFEWNKAIYIMLYLWI